MIGITGVATSGKDTLYSLLSIFLQKKNLKCKRYALADLLKKDLEIFVKEKFNINLNSISAAEKELIRPILVAYGKVKRNQTNGRHWIESINKIIDQENETNDILIVTDIRYDEFEKDEFFWLKKEKNGFLVHISRIFNGKIIGPANEEEHRNNTSLSKKADYHMIWCSENNKEILYNQYEKNLEEIYESYRRHRFNK